MAVAVAASSSSRLWARAPVADPLISSGAAVDSVLVSVVVAVAGGGVDDLTAGAPLSLVSFPGQTGATASVLAREERERLTLLVGLPSWSRLRDRKGESERRKGGATT